MGGTESLQRGFEMTSLCANHACDVDSLFAIVIIVILVITIWWITE